MATNIQDWSTTASDNATADSAINWAENQLPGTVNGSARAMMAAHARWRDDNSGLVNTGGSSNAYTLTTITGHTALATGLTVAFKANHGNNAAATLNVNGLGAKDIKFFDNWFGESDLLPGHIQASGYYRAVYDSALDGSNGAWVLLNPAPTEIAGEIKLYAGSSAPFGWLFCYGQAVSRTAYPRLFATIADTYGVGDGSSTFNLPDLRGRTPFGRDDMGGSAANRVTSSSGITGTTLGATGGAQTVTLATTDIPSHTHTGTSASNGAHSHTATTSSDGAHDHGGATGSDGSHTHSFSATTGAGGSHSHTGTTDSGGSHTHTGTSDSGGAHTHTYSATTDSSGAHTHFAVSTENSVSLGDTLTASNYLSDQLAIVADAAYAAVGVATAASIGLTSSNGAHTHTYSGTTASGGAHSHTFTTDSGGSHTHTFTTGTQADHTHSVSGTTGSGGSHTHTISSGGSHTHTLTTSTDGAHTHTFTSDATGGGGAHNNMPPAIMLNYIIKIF
jgi:microcystin-dependent protein